jgi:hypothetical protein
MRTTIDLPDELYREVRIAAVNRGVTLRELVTGAIEKELHGTDEKPRVRRRVNFPIIQTGPPGSLVITEAVLRQVELEDDLSRSGLRG